MVRTALLIVFSAPWMFGASFSFTGDFTQDDNVQIFDFSVGVASDVTLRSYSYAGGTNAQGAAIARGGFDPILAVFDAAGARINTQDDGGCGAVPADAVTGRCWDVSFTDNLAPGDYRVSVQQFNNFSQGSLSEGFTRSGEGNFTAEEFGPDGAVTPFWDITENQRDSHWAFDILGVSEASQVPPNGTGGEIPEPSTFVLTAAGLLLAAHCSRFKFR